MKHMPRLAIHMEKSVNSLDEFISWVDGVSGDFQGGANSVRLMKSHIWHPPAGSVTLWDEGSEKGKWPLSIFISGRKLSPGSCLDARHFSSSL